MIDKVLADKEYRRLYGVTEKVKKEIEKWLEGEELRIGRLDQVRLLKLKIWEVRYKVKITEILDLIMPVLRSRLPEGTKKRMRSSLGVTIPMLTGPGAERILTEELKKRYEGEENYVEWKENERQRQIDLETEDEFEGLQPRSRSQVVSVLSSTSVKEFANEYETQMLQARKRYQQANSERWRRRKAYRYSPW